MRIIHRLTRILISLVLTALAAAGDISPRRVAILGDSITYDGRWATRVESALRATPEFADAEIVNFGLASETVSGLSEAGHAGGKFPRPCLHERLGRILDAFKPTLVLACYGMNDGIYQPFDESRAKAYQDGILKLKTEVEKREAQIILITPPLHQIDRPDNNPKRYDTVLDAYADAMDAHKTDGWKVIDIRPDLKREVAAAKRADPKFTYAPDGIHPGADGHRFIADSICKQLWPILKLPGTPQFSAADALKILSHRNALLKHAWLSKTGHTRPQVPKGLPLDQAEIQAAKLLIEYRSDAPQKN